MRDGDLLALPAGELARRVRDRVLSAVELLELHVTRIEERNGDLNAIVLPRIDQARAEAADADRALAGGGDVGPLHGVPVTIKDGLALAGMPWPNGSRLDADLVASYDAPAVRRVRAAGAIILGKTNVPEFCAFYDSVNDVFGATRNPYARDRSAGGSSGGEAAAVASGMSALGIGSDLGSSIRNPAHFSGLFGLKPSRQLSPGIGHAPDGEGPVRSQFVAIGPLARSADDLELGLRVLAATPPAPPRPGAGVIGVYEEDIVQPVAADCRRAVRLAADVLAEAGHQLVEDRPPHETQIRADFDLIVLGELVGPLARLVADRSEELSHFGRLTVGSAPTDPMPLGDYVAAWARLGALEREVDAWFESRRLALCPVGPGPAPPLGQGFTEIDGRPPNPGAKFSLCTLANAMGLPAASVPVLQTGSGLPVGVQLIGGRGRDLEVVAAARELERALGGFVAPPDGG